MKLQAYTHPRTPATQSRKRREKAQLTLEELKKDGRLNVLVQPMSIFLLRDGECYAYELICFIIVYIHALSRVYPLIGVVFCIPTSSTRN